MDAQNLQHQKKLNRREAYTLSTIKSVFIEMLKKQSIEQITVGELCKIADINRSTFYRHYSDIYALFDEVCDDYRKLLFDSMILHYKKEGDFEANSFIPLLQACEITEQNKEIFRILLFKQPGSKLLQKITDSMYSLYYNAHLEKQPAFPNMHLHYNYLVSGVIGIWSSWVRDNCSTPKREIANVIRDQMLGFFLLMEKLNNLTEEDLEKKKMQ